MRSPHVSIIPLLALFLFSCGPSKAYFLGTDKAQNRELSQLLSLLDQSGGGEEGFALSQRIASLLLEGGDYPKLANFLTAQANLEPKNPLNAYYLFMAGYAYERQDARPVAAYYFHRVVRDFPDLLVRGESVHLACLKQLIEIEKDPRRRSAYYRELISRFPSSIDMGPCLFMLAQDCEKMGDWPAAIENYERLLPYSDTVIAGFPEAYQYARRTVDFSKSSKDWGYDDLSKLVDDVRQALRDSSPARLERIRAKVNFFAMSWAQEETDENSQVEFSLSAFMYGNQIKAEPIIDPMSNSQVAYLKTSGWADKLSTWYFFFRKINFPSEPEIHGQWEWAGIYFGEKIK